MRSPAVTPGRIYWHFTAISPMEQIRNSGTPRATMGREGAAEQGVPCRVEPGPVPAGPARHNQY